jgi:O-antigen ligase
MWPSPTTALSDQRPLAVPGLNLEQLRRKERRTVALSAGYVLGGTALAALLFLIFGNPIVGAAVIGGVLLVAATVVWLWIQPVRGVYVLFGAAVLLATYVQPGLTDYIGVYLPFWRDIKSYTGTGLVFSVAEAFIALVFLVWLLKGIAERNLRFDRGSLLLPVALYSVAVLVGEFRGLTTGGDFRISLFELRGQVYLVLAYILVCNLVKNRSQINTLLWLLLICAGLRGIEGTIQYFFVLRAQDISTHQLYPHEQSYFFNAFLTLTLILFLFGGSRRMKRCALLFLPFIVIANLANNRRASIAALVISLVVLLLILWITQKRFRRLISIVAVVFLLAFPPYYVAYQNKTGLLALPARAISSNFHPTAADASSNQYRILEDLDIMTTVKSSPIIGYGFGKPMLTPYPLPNINYEFQFVLPHNSILWAWMRLGTIGYLIMWFLIGAAVIQVTQLIRRLRDPVLQGLAVFVLLMLIQQVLISYVDLQWSNYRTMIVTGVLFALISRLGALAQTTRFAVQRPVSRVPIAAPGWRSQEVTPVPAGPGDGAGSNPDGIPSLYLQWQAAVARLIREAHMSPEERSTLSTSTEER